jgi:choline dehydrogenase-like flavoprotein
MFTDARTLEEGITLESDVCIIGAGAAGITLALQFVSTPYKVCVLESGDYRFNEATQQLYQGQSVGLPYSLTASRLRYFGGSTNHWAGNCSPYSAIDFEHRPWLAAQGWPIPRTALDSYYAKAGSLCQLGSDHYDACDFWGPKALQGLSDSARELLEVRIIQKSPPTRFGQQYRADLRKAQNIDICLHANVMAINSSDNGAQITDLQVGCLNGRRFQARARIVVLACGGIENARLLLLSNQVQRDGIGNQHDQVGRYFMENPRLNVGKLMMFKDRLPYDVYGYSDKKGARIRGYWRLHPRLQRQRQLANCDIFFTDTDSSLHALKRIVKRLYRSDQRGSLSNDLGIIVDDMETWTNGLGRSSANSRLIGLEAVLAQRPHAENRVTLDWERDALGLARSRLDWRLTESDKTMLRRTLFTLGKIMGKSGAGRVQLAAWLSNEATNWPQDMYPGNHHMGTTRMSKLPTQGVVDSDCRVHGVENLYIAGSSVFPVCGSANPTLTIVALALRLAERLQQRLQT